MRSTAGRLRKNIDPAGALLQHIHHVRACQRAAPVTDNSHRLVAYVSKRDALSHIALKADEARCGPGGWQAARGVGVGELRDLCPIHQYRVVLALDADFEF